MTPEARIAAVVLRLLTERSITHRVGPSEDLREAGLTSMDMLHLVLAVEAEFDLEIPENHISPANFRCIDAISKLVGTLLPPP